MWINLHLGHQSLTEARSGRIRCDLGDSRFCSKGSKASQKFRGLDEHVWALGLRLGPGHRVNATNSSGFLLFLHVFSCHVTGKLFRIYPQPFVLSFVCRPEVEDDTRGYSIEERRRSGGSDILVCLI